jgi:hypothetical protein
MKAAVFAFILSLTLIIPASAANNFSAGEVSAAHITELYSDLESFDVTLYSDRPYENLTLEVTLLRTAGNSEVVLARQAFPVDGLPENSEVTKVGFWNIGNAERGAYSIRASLNGNGHVLSKSMYDFTYGDNSVFIQPSRRQNWIL